MCTECACAVIETRHATTKRRSLKIMLCVSSHSMIQAFQPKKGKNNSCFFTLSILCCLACKPKLSIFFSPSFKLLLNTCRNAVLKIAFREIEGQCHLSHYILTILLFNSSIHNQEVLKIFPREKQQTDIYCAFKISFGGESSAWLG